MARCVLPVLVGPRTAFDASGETGRGQGHGEGWLGVGGRIASGFEDVVRVPFILGGYSWVMPAMPRVDGRRVRGRGIGPRSTAAELRLLRGQLGSAGTGWPK